MRSNLSLLFLLLLVAAGQAIARAAEKPLDFNRDVRPILSENCFACHGFDEKARKADLRLDDAESALADRDGTPAIVAGHPEKSEAWRRIMSADESEQMPPPDSHRQLKPEQQAVIKRWIEQGAPFAKHWSFIPPVKATVPAAAAEHERWPRNEIDHFVLERLEAEGLSPSPEADRRTLIRRLSLDLTGLPPSAVEVEAFAADESPDAYEKLIDRLLASPHFGERMALVWLDAARYADTNGYSIDGGRHMWMWRDWVINAFNTNLPYDQFLRDQLAGDLLPNRTEAQLIATGFQRNNMNTHEGGTIPEENLTNYNVDRVKTFGEAVLGLTLGCAQCHNHKFDPITQRDYYQVYAYFNTLSDVGLDGDRGVNSRPSIEAKTVLATGEEGQLREQIKALNDKLASVSAADVDRWVGEQRERLKSRGKDLELLPVELLKVSTPNAGAGFDIDPPRFVRITSPAALLAYDVSLRLPKTEKPITGLRVVFHPDQSAPNGGLGFGKLPPAPRRVGASSPAVFANATSKTGGGDASPRRVPSNSAREDTSTFVLTAFTASADPVPGDQVNLNRVLDIAGVTASSWRSDFRPANVIDTRLDGWAPDPQQDGPARLTVTFAKPIDAGETPYMTVQLNFGYGDRLVAARFEIQAMTGTDDDIDIDPEVAKIIASSSAQSAPGSAGGSTNDDVNALRDYFAAHADATKRDRIALANLEERLDVLTNKHSTMVMDVAEKPRETHILNRGDYAQSGEKVVAATPAVLPKLPAGPGSSGGTSTRLDLANWVIMRENPLAARVEVNRLWQIFFGTGLVATPADFGAQGEFPSHPDLLDWLAVDFMEHGWDVKRAVKQMVMSATYRQSSDVGEPLVARDPQNRLLARGPRFRLPAEFIRDAALKVSGLFVDRLGGPSVNPYTPGNLWREISHYGSSPATSQTFEQDHGEKLYRRSLYTYWKRTVPPPNMVAFDAPNRELCTAFRASTTTPLQALVLLNDVQFVEAARAFAERSIKQPGDDVARLRWAFEECVSRTPNDAELAVLAKALGRERARYAANEEAAKKYLAAGESLRDDSIPASEHAAWSQVASLLLNLSEAVTRN
ncbi:MAG: PSD1 and planctomycete cytochrome C domain-containing protein [Pirellulales bacterium]